MRCSSDAHHRWHGNTGAEGVTLPAAQLYEARLGTPTCGCVWKEQSASAPRRWRREGCWLGIGRASAPSCGRRAPAGLHGYGRTCSPASALLVYIPDFSSVTAQIKPQGSSSICMSIESCPITKKTPQNIRFCLHGKEKNPNKKNPQLQLCHLLCFHPQKLEEITWNHDILHLVGKRTFESTKKPHHMKFNILPNLHLTGRFFLVSKPIWWFNDKQSNCHSNQHDGM